MGAFVSKPECQTHYNITLNCDHPKSNETGRLYTSLGDFERGEVPSDPDIAGVGILGVFLAVTSLAIFLSLVDVLWQVAKVWDWKKRYSSKEEKRAKTHGRSFSEILETMIIACSDQQVFTGAAYSLTLRYWRGCTILSYHYNLIANMLLLTCATHLMSVTVVRNYWKFPWLAILRVICISGIFIVAGLLLTNQNAREEDPPFPTEVPPANETDSIIFLPAACFQSQSSGAPETLHATTENGTAFWNTLKRSKPGNLIQGWNWYILILLFYGAAIIAEAIRFVRRGRSRPGWRARLATLFGRCFGRCFGRGTMLRRIVQNVFLLYLAGGVGISIAATIISARYIFSLRRWANDSGWLESDQDGKNPENDFSSFGQLVPIWTSAMIVFSFFGTISEKITRRNNQKHAKEERPPQEGTIAYLDPSHYDLFSPEPGKQNASSYFSPNPNHHTPAAAAVGSIDLEAQHSTPPSQINISSANSKPLGSLPFLSSSPLLGGAGLAITTPATPPPLSLNETSTTDTVAGAGTGHPNDGPDTTPPGNTHDASFQCGDHGIDSSASSQSSPPSQTRPQAATPMPSQPPAKEKPTPKKDSSS